jgi:hypothetical protein
VLHVLAVVSFPSGRGRRAPSDPSPRDLGARSRAPWPRRRSWCWASSTVSTTQQGEGEARSRREGYWSSSIGAGAGRGGSSKERCPRRRQRVPRHLLPLRRRRRAHHHLPSEARIRRRDVDPGPAASLPICTWPRGALEERGGAHGRWLGEATTSFTPVGRLLPHAAALPPPPPPPPPLLLLSLRAREPTTRLDATPVARCLLEAPLLSCACIVSLLFFKRGCRRGNPWRQT